jgi:hypothetical protein
MFWWGYVLGLRLLGHRNVCRVAYGLYVLRFKFWRSCFMMRNFWPVETNVKLSLKDDMLLCWFTSKLMLLLRGNLCRVALKWAMHLWLVIEIMSRYITLKNIPTQNTSWTWLHANASMATGLMHPWLHRRCIHGYIANVSMATGLMHPW